MMGTIQKSLTVAETVGALASLSDDEWKSRHGALVKELREVRATGTVDGILVAVKAVGALSGTDRANEIEALAKDAVTVSKRADSAVGDVVRALFLNLTDAKVAKVERITQTDLAKSLGCDQSRVSRHLARAKVSKVTAALKARGLEADATAVADKVRTVTGFREAMSEAQTVESTPEWAHPADTAPAGPSHSPADALLKSADALLKTSGEIVVTDANRETVRRALVALQHAARNLSALLKSEPVAV